MSDALYRDDTADVNVTVDLSQIAESFGEIYHPEQLFARFMVSVLDNLDNYDDRDLMIRCLRNALDEYEQGMNG